MNALHLIIMNILNFSMGQGETHYTKASVNRIIEILAEFYDVHVHRRWVFYCIRWLIDHGYITRKPRVYNDSAGRVSKKSSMIAFTIKGFKHLTKMGVTSARAIKDSMIAWSNRHDGRWPSEHHFDGRSYPSDKPQDKERLKQLLGGIGGSIKNKKVTK